MGAQKRAIPVLIELAGRYSHYGQRGVFLGSREPIAVHLQKEDSEDEADSLIAVHERMILNDSGGVNGG